MHIQPIASLLGLWVTISSGLIAPVRSIAASPTVNIAHARSVAPQSLLQQIVLIKTRSSQGSGVIIKRTGNTYTILTAAHVVNALSSSPVEIITPDLQQYTTSPSEVKIAPNSLDLATVTFQSDRNYIVAELGDSNTLDKGQPIFAAGFHGKSLKFYPGTVVAISRQSQDRGYGLAIGTAEMLPGMSGGGLFNNVGSLIGINGKSIGTSDADVRQNDGNRIKPLTGLAIPINTFTRIASQLNVDIDNKLPLLGALKPTADDFFITAGTKSQQGDYQGAVTDYDRTLAMNPQFGEVYFRRGIARSLLKDWQGAEADYTRAIEIEPRYPEAYLHRGNVRNSLTNWRGAKSDFDLAIALNPNRSSAYLGRGVALCELNDCQGGLTDYNRAILLQHSSANTLNRSDAEVYTRRGFAYYRLGNPQAAIDSYLTAAELYRKQGKDRDYLDTVQKIKQLIRR
ncbi:MAG: tetratricopeptide repeat-containing serine protease family protein [Chamaesiphon sp.]|nr:tetratricopeptide repeat-containing serine protease family protein [Chamaesiphon sp.]